MACDLDTTHVKLNTPGSFDTLVHFLDKFLIWKHINTPFHAFFLVCFYSLRPYLYAYKNMLQKDV